MNERSSTPDSSVVLIAEDEPIIRSLLRVLLERLGLQVLSAGDGAEAWEIFQAHAEEISIVITDLNMPRLDGPGLLRRLSEHPRHPSVIVTSGLPEMIDEVRRIWGDEVVVMPKPYDAKDLAHALERARHTVASS
jgi:CheY-like chemotaxis protein